MKFKNVKRDSNPKVSIILVYYHEPDKLVKTIESIVKSKPKIKYEIIVVDNSSKKVSKLLQKFRKVKYLKSPGNIGYASGNNLGFKSSKGKYIFILNPDTEFLGNPIDKLCEFLDKNKNVAIVAPNLLDEKKQAFKFQGTRKLTPIRAIFALSFLNVLFPKNYFSVKYWMKDVKKTKKRKVDVVPGSAFMIRRNVFEEVSGFDENFFLFFEESDLCNRVRDLDFDIWMLASAKVIHYWQPGEGGNILKKAFEKSRFFYFKKNFGIVYALFVELFLKYFNIFCLVIVIILLLYIFKI